MNILVNLSILWLKLEWRIIEMLLTGRFIRRRLFRIYLYVSK